MRPVTFAPTLVDSSFSSTLMNFTIHAPHSVGIPARPVVERSWLGRLLGIFGQDSTRTRYDATFVNASTGLYSERGLLELGARMLAECNRAKQPLALVLLNFRDLDELRKGYRAPVARKAAKVVAHRCLVLAGIGGLAARTGSSEFALLLPGTTVSKALAALRADLGQYPFIACDIKNESIDLMASVKAAVVTSDESVVPALAMVRGMPPLTVLVSEAAPSREAERKAFDLPDRDFAAMAFPSTMPASLIAA